VRRGAPGDSVNTLTLTFPFGQTVVALAILPSAAGNAWASRMAQASVTLLDASGNTLSSVINMAAVSSGVSWIHFCTASALRHHRRALHVRVPQLVRS
jgi:hypothetical protein